MDYASTEVLRFAQDDSPRCDIPIFPDDRAELCSELLRQQR